jgi:hypothetical protein
MCLSNMADMLNVEYLSAQSVLPLLVFVKLEVLYYHIPLDWIGHKKIT